ncbi:hypothetical protein CORC01_08069 [Colletotrichum orchidophilum]|uniref:Uncharacterized protein n=1 Tax=Colletotrichum orchidophilum TaxID=1209926 RepID=A0A1G4B5P8_9PEZI|nr:uncharacterized protein CORC01_08069 [Colletotrichum orchidophilum]OHE96612.1 hypothetical protein CORC01_08069 [Colletotrichum orchidophilum]
MADFLVLPSHPLLSRASQPSPSQHWTTSRSSLLRYGTGRC